MKERPNYYAILSANVRYDNQLKPNEKLLYAEITALSNFKGVCWASNKYFADLYEVSVRSISDWVSHLKERGYIDIEYIYKEGSKEIKRREIRLSRGEDNFVGGIEENFHTPIEENFRGNTTSTNTTSINNIVDYLNRRADKNFRSSTQSTKKHINARLNEGFTEEDFKKVIDSKVHEWGNSDMSKYIRPQTLFGSKFESYLNENKEKSSNKKKYQSVDDIFSSID